MAQGLARFGDTQQRLLRQLLHAGPDGSAVETLCDRLRVSHNAVRQHLTALIGQGVVERAPSQPTGGRPQARFALTAASHLEEGPDRGHLLESIEALDAALNVGGELDMCLGRRGALRAPYPPRGHLRARGARLGVGAGRSRGLGTQ